MIVKTEVTPDGIRVTYERQDKSQYDITFSFNDEGFYFSTSFVVIDKIAKNAANVGRVDVVKY